MKPVDNKSNVANFTLAVDRNFKSRNGQYGTDFIRCSAWNQNANYIKTHVKKGTLVYVDGSIQTSTKPDKNNPKQNHYYTDVHVENIGLLGHSSSNNNNNSQSASSSNPNSSASSTTSSKSTQSKSSNSSKKSSNDDDDLPF